MTADAAVRAFLLEPVGRGVTVLVLGSLAASLCEAVTAAIGPTGLLVIAAPEPGGCPHAGRVRAALHAVPVLSHAADIVLITDLRHEPADTVAEETRRL